MRHYCASEDLSLVDVVKLLRSLLASKRGDAAGGSPEITAVEDRFSSVLAGELGKWSVVIHHIEYTASLGSVFGSAVVRMSCDTRHIAEKLICVVGTSAGVPVTRAEMESSLARMTKELSETIKAVIDAKFGELGPAGVLAIEDCVQKLKAATDQLGAGRIRSYQLCLPFSWKSRSVLWPLVVQRPSVQVSCPMCQLRSEECGRWCRRVEELLPHQNLVKNLKRSWEGF